MQKYNENQENKDVFFQEMVKEKTNTTKEISDKITEDEDPWMKKVNENKVVENEVVVEEDVTIEK